MNIRIPTVFFKYDGVLLRSLVQGLFHVNWLQDEIAPGHVCWGFPNWRIVC